MALPLAVPIAIGAAQAGSGILSAFGQHSEATAKARAQNQAAVNQYKQRLKIRDLEYKQGQARYGTALGQYDINMNEFDRAAAQGYGREMLKQNEALRSANLSRLSQAMTLAQTGGAAAASGKSGRSASRLDQNAIGQYVRNQGVLAENMLSNRIATQQRMEDIRNNLTGARNRAFSKVAIAPQKTIAPLAPTQVSGPSTMGLLGNIGSSIISGVTTGMSLAAPNVGGGDIPNGNSDYYGIGGKYGAFDPSTIPSLP